jgi:hypothetical protein
MFIGTWGRCQCSPVPKSQKIIDLALSPAVILGRERIDAGIDADVANKQIRILDKVSYLINSSPAETTCGSCHRRAPSLPSVRYLAFGSQIRQWPSLTGGAQARLASRPREGRTARRGSRAVRHPASRASAQGVKLEPIGARRFPASLSRVEQKSRKAFIFWHFRRFQQAEKAARHQVVWSWRPDAGAKFRGDDPRSDGGKQAGHRREHEGNRKTTAQGRPECFRFTCGPTPVLFVARGPRVQSAPGLPCALCLSREGGT